MPVPHPEAHLLGRTGWLRADVLGPNDRIISAASLIPGVLSASGLRHDALVAGMAGLVAGAMSMVAGEYVSVSSQSDTETAALAKERAEAKQSLSPTLVQNIRNARDPRVGWAHVVARPAPEPSRGRRGLPPCFQP